MQAAIGARARSLYARVICARAGSVSGRSASARALEGLDPSALRDLARQHLRAGRYADAEQALWVALRAAPRSASTRYLVGLGALHRDRVRRARRLIDRAYEAHHWLDDRVDSPDALLLLERARRTLPDWDWAHYQFDRARWHATGLGLGAAIDHLVAMGGNRPTFVQIGAHDGLRSDPLSDLIGRHGMSGLFVEPQAEPFARLRERYAGAPGLSFAQAAVTEADGPVTLYTDPSRMTLGTLTPDRNMMRGRAGSAVETTVVGRTFASLAAEHHVERCDVLQIDTEGHDYAILEQVALDDLDVKIVNMEYFCLPVAERRAAGELLQGTGFGLFYGQMDLLAVRLDVFGERFGITDRSTRTSLDTGR